MVNQIVTLNVSQTQPAAPDTLQRTGAFVTQGGSNKAANTFTLVTSLDDVTAALAPQLAIATITWASGGGGTVTVTTSAPHGWTNADVIPVTVAGMTPAGYNGTFTGTITGTTTLTYPLTPNPGASSVLGTVSLGARTELLAMGTTFFAQGSGVSAYILELGEAMVTAGVASLTTWLTANVRKAYSFLMPRNWDANSAFLTLIGQYEALTAMTYFHVTTTTGTYTSYTALMKDVLATVEASGIPATEFTAAAQFWNTLRNSPSSSSKVAPLAFRYVFGVTPYPTSGNSTLLASLKTANIGYIGTGAEGGISTAILFWGNTLDGKPFNYWYSLDWVQINMQRALANAVINGSNDGVAPLLYDQQGINVLQDVAIGVFSQAVSYGLATGTIQQTQLAAATFQQNYLNKAYLGQLVVNAEPFLVYTAENPSDYAIGKYAGFAGTYIFANGFTQIVFNLNATSFV